MQNRRLLFGLIIKLLTYTGLLLLIVVFVNSLFMKTDSALVVAENEVPVVILDITDMQKGEVKKVRWDNSDVAILLRQFPEKLDELKTVTSEEGLHPSIDPQIRSKKIEYFVFVNTGDSRNCPLYHSGGEFKDVCSSNRFDETGRELNTDFQNFMLKIPPHYFEKEQVIFGKWQP